MKDSAVLAQAAQGRWEPARAWAWYQARPWLRGCNFNPSSAINQLEMWQPETFDPEINRCELGLLAELGLNSVRVFLHDLLWRDDAPGLFGRMERFLGIANELGIGVLFVFFDSCWGPVPRSGPQPAPRPGMHNGGWVQSPGIDVLRDEREQARLEGYIRGVVGHFREDARIHGWDIWNEPSNHSTEVSGTEEKIRLVLPLLVRAFQWARSADPSQPLTSGIWRTEEWETPSLLARAQLEASDVISFHCYEPLPATQARVEKLKKLGRPLLCTEYLARGTGSTFQSILPYFHDEKIAAYNWGAVSGKTQTRFPWNSGDQAHAAEPVPWHHEIFHPDGTPYDPAETDLIRSFRGR